VPDGSGPPGQAAPATRAAASADILVVEDEPAIRAALERSLRDAGYRPRTAADVHGARALLTDGAFELLLCDINLGAHSGLELVREVARDRPDTAIVMVTGADDRTTAGAAIDLGAHGYLVKPFSATELVIQVDIALRHRALERARRLHVDELELKLLDRSASLREALARVASIEGSAERSARRSSSTVAREVADRLAAALALRDEETGHHVARVGRYSAVVAGAAALDTWPRDDLQVAAMLHDVGKIAVPDTVLLKPGPLTEEDWLLVRRHPEAGFRLLEGADTDVLRLAASMALTHHERWDGAGYPRGLRGTEIPLEGRVVALADVFDALTSVRVYKAASGIEEAVSLLRCGRGTHFDPDLLDAFVGELDALAAIRDELADPPPPADAIDVLVVEPRRLYGETLVRLLDRAAGIGWTGWAPDADATMRAVRRHPVDVVVTDWELPDGGAAPLVRRLLAEHPGLRVLVVADACDEALLLSALDAGCCGCVTKLQALDDLTATIRLAHAGEPVGPAAQLSSLLRRMDPRPLPASSVPSAGEREVLVLLADGLSVGAIAEHLGLDVDVVVGQVERLRQKLDATTRFDVVAAGARAGFLGPSAG